MEINEFFDNNSNFYNQHLLRYDYDFMEFIKNKGTDNSYLLDVGGGNGNFSRLIIQNCPNINVTIVDPSKELLNKLDIPQINKIIGKLPNDIPLNSKYDYIHIKEVLHHVTGNTIPETKGLLKKSLNNLKHVLNQDGFLLIHELYYEGFLVPKFPSYVLFHLLKFQNKFNLKIPIKEFLLGLDIYFYTREELEITLKECGFEIISYKNDEWENSVQKKALLLKNWGRVLIIAKKVE